jgi:hypothetical protein
MALKLNQNHNGYLPIGTSVQAASTVHDAAKPNKNESFFVGHDRDLHCGELVVGNHWHG